MTEKRGWQYEPDRLLRWGIDPDGRSNKAKLAATVESAIEIAQPERIIFFG